MIRPTSVSAVAVATAGTRVQASATSKTAPTIIFQADSANTGNMYIGDSSVAAANGISLSAGQIMSFSADPRPMGGTDELDLSDFYIDAAVNGESVRVVLMRRQ